MISCAVGTAPSATSPSEPGFTAAPSAVFDTALPYVVPHGNEPN